MSKPFRVLSLDGGGMRGIYTAAFLETLASEHAKTRGGKSLDLGKGFDLIVGTSTGAIVGLAAAAGIPMVEVVELYKKHGPQIFPLRIGPWWNLLTNILFRPYYLNVGAKALTAALGCTLKATTIGELYNLRKIAVCIPAVDVSQQRAIVFKTPHLGGHRDDGRTLVDVCLATTAAPIFRAMTSLKMPAGLKQQGVYVDGGLWANNPVMVGLTEALQMIQPGQKIEIYCMGTCPRPEGEEIKEKDLYRGLIGWRFGAKVAQTSVAAQEHAFDEMARLTANSLARLGVDVSVVRFPNEDVPHWMMKYLDLDDSREEAMNALVNQAATDVNVTRSACDDVRNASGQLIRRLFDDMPLI